MSDSQEPPGEPSGSKKALASDSAEDTTAPRNSNADTQMSEGDLRAFLNSDPNSGFLRMIHSREQNARIMYHFINWLINLLLITQAALSAVLVAVGATEKKYQKVVAILGAVSGVITGILAIIKGQGLPGRYYQYAAGLRAVIREVEKLKRRMAANGVVTRQDCEKLLELYESVEKENDMNTPDIWRTGRILLEE